MKMMTSKVAAPNYHRVEAVRAQAITVRIKNHQISKNHPRMFRPTLNHKTAKKELSHKSRNNFKKELRAGK